MRTIQVRAHASLAADAAFDRIARLDSEWRVPFRGGFIRWTQRCTPVPEQRTITFTQADGSFQGLSGAWRVTPEPDGCEVLFEATYDVGVPIYDRILDPLVERALTDSVRAVIAGL